MLAGMALRTWNINFDGGLNAHPDERSTTCFYAPTLGWPTSLDEFLDPERSPLNPLWDRHNDRRRSYTYGHFPLYMGILSGELLSKLAKPASLLPLPDRTISLMERANTACDGVAFAGRLMMALLDTLTDLSSSSCWGEDCIRHNRPDYWRRLFTRSLPRRFNSATSSPWILPALRL